MTRPRPATDVPPYRTTPESLYEHPMYAKAGADGMFVWNTLRLMIRPPGIAAVRPSLLCDVLQWDPARLEAAMQRLEEPWPNREFGWIVRDGTLVWVVDELAMSYYLFATNPKHVESKQRAIAAFDSGSPLIVAFRRYYAEWFQGYSVPYRPGFDTPIAAATENEGTVPGTVGGTVDGRVEGTVPGTVGGRVPGTRSGSSSSNSSLKSEKPLLPRAEPADGRASREGSVSPSPTTTAASLALVAPASSFSVPEAIAALGKAGHLPDTRTFLAKYYGAKDASDERRRAVVDQINAVASEEGLAFEGQRLFGQTRKRIAKKCKEIMTQKKPVENFDRAIVILLYKLADLSDGSAVGKLQSDAEKATANHDAGAYAQKIERATAWLMAHPDVEREVKRKTERDGFSAQATEGVDAYAYRVALTANVIALWEEHGAPSVSQNGRRAGGESRPPPARKRHHHIAAPRRRR